MPWTVTVGAAFDSSSLLIVPKTQEIKSYTRNVSGKLLVSKVRVMEVIQAAALASKSLSISGCDHVGESFRKDEKFIRV